MQAEIITVATYPNAWEAQAARNFLESNGVRAFVADEHFSTSQPFLSSIKLQVAAVDAERAKQLLSAAH